MAKHVLVIGAGSIGLCTAYYALQKGHRVTVVERGAPDHECCSLGNAGLIVPSHFVPLAAPGVVAQGLRMTLNPRSPFYIRPRASRELIDWCRKFYRAANARHVARAAPVLRDLNMASRRCYEELAGLPGADFGLVKNGLLMLCRTEARLREEAELAEAGRKLGLSVDVLTPEETARLNPGLRMEIAGAVLFADDCHLTPQRFIAWLAKTVEAAGAEMRWSTQINGWRADGKHIAAVRTSRGDLSGDEYVLAAGSWSPRLARMLGLSLPLQAGKGYNVTLAQPRFQPTVPCTLTEARVAVTPMGATLRFAGTMEIAGLDPSISRTRVDAITNAVPRYFPDFKREDFQDAPAWSGLRPCSPDGLPYLGRFGRYANLSAATGHAMMGLSLGPITGRLLAELLSGEEPSLDTSVHSPDRYA
jgi:D-amino-acid dehydrogenase